MFTKKPTKNAVFLQFIDFLTIQKKLNFYQNPVVTVQKSAST